MADLAERIATERRLRGWSARDAARQGDISNTTWSKFEAGGELGDAIRQGVALAFGWPLDWPENPPVISMGHRDEIAEAMAELEAQLGAARSAITTHEARISALEAQMERMTSQWAVATDEQFAVAAEGAGGRPPRRRGGRTVNRPTGVPVEE